jgi:hypothetical protein
MHDLKALNAERSKMMESTCLSMGFFPVIVGPISPEGDMMVFSFSNADKRTLQKMLTDFLRSLDGDRGVEMFVVPDLSGK